MARRKSEAGELIDIAARGGAPGYAISPQAILRSRVAARAGFRCHDCGAAGLLRVVDKGATLRLVRPEGPAPDDLRAYKAVCAGGCDPARAAAAKAARRR